jgi:hypothetical protein
MNGSLKLSQKKQEASIQNIAPKCRMSNIAGGVRLAATAFVAVLDVLFQHTANRIGRSYDFAAEIIVVLSSMRLRHEGWSGIMMLCIPTLQFLPATVAKVLVVCFLLLKGNVLRFIELLA